MTAPLLPQLLPDSAPHIYADLSYFQPPPNGDVPWTTQYPAPGGKSRQSNVTPKEVKFPIYDLRGVDPAETHIDVTGFQVVSDIEERRTKMKYDDWQDERKITEVYYPEVERLLKKATGASKVIIFDHTIRRTEREGEETPDEPTNRKPVPLVHVDQTEQSGARRVLRHAESKEEGERLLRGKAKLVNLWRPFKTVYDMPLAYADARTLSRDDLVKSRLLYKPPTPEGETYQVQLNPNHRFYYLSEMQPDEAVMLQCWTNDESGGPMTPHTAFKDERYWGKEGVELRESIEIRSLLFFDTE
ncbi:BQ2448_3132 [Microbotryum intermedium]|uniref:BQ2448_3132 protein n=1 Tax=Microbotryum intermedium TaxID=269621 RepID=A0A238FI47_9BASI|nr:BQ2448_3132 [Microbotryum intermedium]